MPGHSAFCTRHSFARPSSRVVARPNRTPRRAQAWLGALGRLLPGLEALDHGAHAQRNGLAVEERVGPHEIADEGNPTVRPCRGRRPPALRATRHAPRSSSGRSSSFRLSSGWSPRLSYAPPSRSLAVRPFAHGKVEIVQDKRGETAGEGGRGGDRVRQAKIGRRLDATHHPVADEVPFEAEADAGRQVRGVEDEPAASRTGP